MDAKSQINDPGLWRRRAEEARRTAEQLDDAVSQKVLRDIADYYEQLARHVETRNGPRE
jgi:Mn-dependent DtxR family transcriptional regulator